MSRTFENILVTVDPKPDAHELLDCYDELRAIYEDLGEGHNYSVFAQVFGHAEDPLKFYLTGKILTPAQGERIRAILAE